MKPEELAARLSPELIANSKRRLMQRLVLTVEGASKKRTPVRTGTLRRSITSRVEGTGERGVVGTNVSYARYVHDGTRHMQARPFFQQGLAASRDSINDILEDWGDELFKAVAR